MLATTASRIQRSARGRERNPVQTAPSGLTGLCHRCALSGIVYVSQIVAEYHEAIIRVSQDCNGDFLSVAALFGVRRNRRGLRAPACLGFKGGTHGVEDCHSRYEKQTHNDVSHSAPPGGVGAFMYVCRFKRTRGMCTRVWSSCVRMGASVPTSSMCVVRIEAL